MTSPSRTDVQECISLLCAKDANTEAKCSEYGMTAFLIACENGCDSAVTMLASKGANVKATDNDRSNGRKLAASEDPPHDNVLAALDGTSIDTDAKFASSTRTVSICVAAVRVRRAAGGRATPGGG
jgi:ankyrin repeat protein